MYSTHIPLEHVCSGTHRLKTTARQRLSSEDKPTKKVHPKMRKLKSLGSKFAALRGVPETPAQIEWVGVKEGVSRAAVGRSASWSPLQSDQAHTSTHNVSDSLCASTAPLPTHPFFHRHAFNSELSQRAWAAPSNLSQREFFSLSCTSRRADGGSRDTPKSTRPRTA